MRMMFTSAVSASTSSTAEIQAKTSGQPALISALACGRSAALKSTTRKTMVLRQGLRCL